MTADEWLERYASALGVPTPTADDVASLLELAGVAAHASERVAAPISCWLVARADMPLADALALSRRLAADIASEDDHA